jgi:hypothetical protein
MRMIRCFESCDRFQEAEVEGLKLLEKLHGGKRKGKKILPEVGNSGCGDDGDFCELVVEIAFSLLKCAASMAPDKDDDYLRRMLCLIDEVKPWLR